jgi:hypothetical protein
MAKKTADDLPTELRTGWARRGAGRRIRLDQRSQDPARKDR